MWSVAEIVRVDGGLGMSEDDVFDGPGIQCQSYHCVYDIYPFEKRVLENSIIS